jgi:hypothetical protein
VSNDGLAVFYFAVCITVINVEDRIFDELKKMW